MKLFQPISLPDEFECAGFEQCRVRFVQVVLRLAEIYGGSIGLEESEDLGGLLVRLRLPAG